jgi:uncharacterized membrane-anchored protein
MKNTIIAFFLAFLSIQVVFPQKDSSTVSEKEMKELNEIFTFEKSIPYKYGNLSLTEKVSLNIPKGYKFIPKKEAETIIFKHWGNPESEGILGMLVLDNFQFYNTGDWAFVVSEQLEGYVKDEDAKDMDYDDLLKEIKDSEVEENKQRKENGYEPIYTIGWASKPFYDEKMKILHWAKELQFGDQKSEHTLNYDVRILGREGLLSMNAVGVMGSLDSVKKHIPDIINIAKFTDGHKYADFDKKTDNVAAYTIGGLVAGKLLAKAGLFALLLKNIKLVIIGLIALFSSFKNKLFGLFGRKKEENFEEINDIEPEKES